MERLVNIEKNFNKERLKDGLDSFLFYIGIKEKNERDEIVRSIMKATQEKEYFEEKEFVEIIEKTLKEKGVDENLIDEILPKSNGERLLHNTLRINFENYYRTSPEKKGINFRDRLEEPGYVRAYLYLILPEDQRGAFKGDFEKLSTQKEEFFFRFWPPKIALRFKELLRGKISGDFKPGEFFEEVKSYIEDLQKGKDRITLYFSPDLLPNELKGRQEEELEKFGVHKANDGNYEIYITPDKIQDVLFNLVERTLSVSEKETEIGKKLTNINELFKEVRKNLKSLPEGQVILASYAGLIAALEEQYREGLRRGMSEEESKKLLEALNKLEGNLKEIAELSKDEKQRKSLLARAKGWLKENASIIASSIGLWGLAIGWFLPLWMINKMYETIEKGPLMK